MDLSIVAAAGSFLVSERILGPKTFIVVGLSLLLSYDLMTKTHDPASLRVYRGPGILGFALMCAAYSLRTWRRNGIACDELIFLPGTKHGSKIGSNSTLEHFVKRLSSTNIPEEATLPNDENNQKVDEVSDVPVLHNSSTLSQESRQNIADIENNAQMKRRINEKNEKVALIPNWSNESQQNIVDDTNANDDGNESIISLRSTESWEIEGDGDYAYAPSATTVFGGGLDLVIPVLFNFHLFTEAIAHQQQAEGELSPKILPLIFLTILYFRAFIPFQRRRRFFGTLKYTFIAPFHHVSFRDDFTADILTSFVRPLQDMMFAIFYYFTVIRGMIWHGYKLEDLDNLLEKNWVLHNLLFPACAILPLWFKFMQCIRLVYDSKQRWPHLGNALKYLSAALLILYAMEHQSSHKGPGWICCFIMATVYQIYWDTMIDWELFEIQSGNKCVEEFKVSSFQTSNSTSSNMKVVACRLLQLLRRKVMFLYSQVHLRKKRLFNDLFYWRLFWINVCLRCLWMLNFIPAHHLSSTGEKIYSFSSDTHTYTGVIISSAEIIRRCLWGIVRVEIESIKITDPAYASREESASTPSKASKEGTTKKAKSLYPSISPFFATKLELFELCFYIVVSSALGYFACMAR